MMFAKIERIPRYADGERENNAEHSFMLALVAPAIAKALDLPYDSGLIAEFATVHDLIELKTGDIATFMISADDQEQKEATEHSALPQLLAELPPHTGEMLLRYELQNEPESRFVRYIDKLLPTVIDVIGAGRKVMCEDYGVETLKQLEVAHNLLEARISEMFKGEFPDIDLAHKLLCELFEARFEEMV